MVVSKPLSVARNGGEVSVGGQHNILVPPLFVAVKFAPFAIFFTNGSSNVIVLVEMSTPIIFDWALRSLPSPLEKADPWTTQSVPTISEKDGSFSTTIEVLLKLPEPSTVASAVAAAVKQTVCKSDGSGVQYPINVSLIKPLDW